MTEARTRAVGVEKPLPRALRYLWVAVVAVSILPIFAHGCHTGDHDIEPQFTPVDHRTATPELPK